MPAQINIPERPTSAAVSLPMDTSTRATRKAPDGKCVCPVGPEYDLWRGIMTYRLCTAIALSGIAVAACGDPATNDPTAPPSETGAGLQDRGLARASNTWVAKAKMPAARRYAVAATVGNFIYVIGGTTGNGTF